MSEPAILTRLQAEIEGEVLTGAFDRGRYATDASIYQIVPRAVVVPRRWSDVEATLSVAREMGVPVTARGGGTSQAGQTINDSIVIDFSRHLNRVLDYDPATRRATVEPGLVLDELNRHLKPDGLWFPVDVSTASRATIGGMTANNSCGSRSIRYGMMRDNVRSLDAMMADGSKRHFGPVASGEDALANDLLALGAREAEEIVARLPRAARRVGGYNIDALVPANAPANLATLLVGSEGTLAITERVELELSSVLGGKALGVCHFPTFYAAMDAAQHIVKLGPVAVELVDHNMIALGRDIPQFRPIVDEFVRGEPAALLLVEFAEDDPAENARRLAGLGDLMADLGFAFDDPGKQEGGVVEAADPAFQARIWGVRTQGLNIMMSMKTEGKPVSFVEDCAVALEHLADFTERLTTVFRKHGTDGTWYAHASVGLLHVRPVLNLKEELGAKQLRAIAEEAFDLVAEYRGSHSGEHGDGIVRSEFHEKMFGSRIVRAFEEVKDRFDPDGLLNPGKITRAPKMDDRTLFRTPPGYARQTPPTAFDWSGWPGGFAGAAEMCNNNGACRKLQGGAMCPELSRNPQRAGSDTGQGKHPAPRPDRAAWPGCAGQRRDDGDDEALRLLQGLQARMPDVRRYGGDEGRGAGGTGRGARHLPTRPAGGASATLRALRLAPAMARQFAGQRAGARSPFGADAGPQRPPHPAAMAAPVPRGKGQGSWKGGRSVALRRYLQPLFSSRKTSTPPLRFWTGPVTL